MMEFPGKHCKAAGIRLCDLRENNFKQLEVKTLTNGIVFELNSYCRIRHLPDDILFNWIQGISPETESDIDRLSLFKKISDLKKQRDFIRKRKAPPYLFNELECQPFFPIPACTDVSELNSVNEATQATAFSTTLPIQVASPEDGPPEDKPADFTRQTTQEDNPATIHTRQPSSEEGVDPIVCHIPLSKDTKDHNTLCYLISVKEKRLASLNTDILRLQDQLKKQCSRNRYYSPKYVDAREQSKNKTIKNLREKARKTVSLRRNAKQVKIVRKEKQELQKCLTAKESENLELKTKIETLLCRLRQEQKMKSYYKTIERSKSKHTGKNTSEFRNLRRYVTVLESRLLDSAEKLSEKVVATRTSGGVFTNEVRLAVIELLGLEVAIHKVSPVIKVISKYVFNHNFKDCELPSRQTVLRISDEGQYLTKCYYAEKMKDCSNFGLNKDGTSRKKIKMLETSVTLDTGEVLPLGFRRIAKEDSLSILQNTQLEINELSQIYKVGTEVDTFKVGVLEKLSYFMSDRAANEKKANELLNDWVQEELTKAEAPSTTIHTLHCMAHVLLGFHRYTLEKLTSLQEEVIAVGGKIGRDAHGAFRFFKGEVAPFRIVRMVSEVVGPNVDEKNGIRDKWLADLATRNQKSLIADYRDNRFNGVFWVAAQIMYHVDDILGLEKRLKNPNLKIKSVFLDLKDSRLITMVQAIGLVYVKITEPYWRLVMSKEVSYLDLHYYIQRLLSKLKFYSDNPAQLVTDEEEIIPHFPANVDHVLYLPTIQLRHQDREDLFHRTIVAILEGFCKCIKQQLVDFLPGGKYGLVPDELQKTRVHGSGLHNLTSERNFGSLDSSQRRRRHATFHFHTSVLLLKTNRKALAAWIKAKPKGERKQLLGKAKAHAKWLRNKHQREERAQKMKEQTSLGITEREKKRKAARTLVKKAREQKQMKKNNPRSTRPKVTVAALVPKPKAVDGIEPDDWVAVAYENGWYLGQVYLSPPENITFVFLGSTEVVLSWNLTQRDDVIFNITALENSELGMQKRNATDLINGSQSVEYTTSNDTVSVSDTMEDPNITLHNLPTGAPVEVPTSANDTQDSRWVQPSCAEVQHFLVFYRARDQRDTMTEVVVDPALREIILSKLKWGTIYIVSVQVVYKGGYRMASDWKDFQTQGYGPDNQCECDRHGRDPENPNCDSQRNLWCQCREGYTGLFCDQCKPGYYRVSPSFPCHRCPCGRTHSSGICVFANHHVTCTECFVGYTGNLCHTCMYGYFSHHGRCEKCNCNGNEDSTETYMCSPMSGKCYGCLHNTSGHSCGVCKPGYTGDPINAKNCTLISEVTAGQSKAPGVGIIAAVCIVIILSLSALAGLIVYRKWNHLPSIKQFWTVELRDNHETVSFSGVPDDVITSDARTFDDMAFYEKQNRDTRKGKDSSYAPLREDF